jgi:antitoxin (DNA-binding transcriptional repressor) of toxin-antitoxin stability system
MSHNMSIAEAASRLAEVLASLGPDDEVVLTDGDRRVARIVPERVTPQPRVPGTCKGMLIINAEDEEHLNDFREYQP